MYYIPVNHLRQKMRMKGTILFTVLLCLFASCSAPTYLQGPTIEFHVKDNICTFGIQNMDNDSKVENEALTCHYDGFDIQYTIGENFVVSLVIMNNSNKSLILDKSKCYVLYNGYATQLFKDVRSSRSTTFNNVQDAIDNVQTNESGVSMTIPPYSKWALPIQETNIRKIKKLPGFREEVGIHSLTAFDNPETVEFVIPYSYDYALAKWNTCRNRVYVNSIRCEDRHLTNRQEYADIGASLINTKQYMIRCKNGLPDFTEANRIDKINAQKYKRHKRNVKWAQFLGGPFTLFISWAYLGSGGCINIDHEPVRYGDGSVQGSFRYNKNY